jgi:hypothetical protein
VDLDEKAECAAGALKSALATAMGQTVNGLEDGAASSFALIQCASARLLAAWRAHVERGNEFGEARHDQERALGTFWRGGCQ